MPDNVSRHPLREDVSWNNTTYKYLAELNGHPLREDVSWNTVKESWWSRLTMSSSSWGCELKLPQSRVNVGFSLSSSSWGCELKYATNTLRERGCTVILFVRMWVEIAEKRKLQKLLASSSSWGCELKYTFIRSVHDLNSVILFVRMWVEILCTLRYFPCSCCHPLREDVSWNIWTIMTL